MNIQIFKENLLKTIEEISKKIGLKGIISQFTASISCFYNTGFRDFVTFGIGKLVISVFSHSGERGSETMKLSQIRLITNDIHKSVAFYRDVMEFALGYYAEGMEFASFNTGETKIEIFSRHQISEVIGEKICQPTWSHHRNSYSVLRWIKSMRFTSV